VKAEKNLQKMGKRNRDLCNFLFFIKAMLAILLGSSALGYQGYLVYREHRNGKCENLLMKCLQIVWKSLMNFYGF
jgi:hypothetical protein